MQILNLFYISLVFHMLNLKLKILGYDNLPHLKGISSWDSERLGIRIKQIIMVALWLLTRYDLEFKD